MGELLISQRSLPPRVLILLATYNGARFLDAQLESLAKQRGARLDVRVSDDGSLDATLAILEVWQRRWSKGSFQILHGPGRGFAENFRTLATDVEADYDFVAFCDQDDVWDTDKVAVAIEALSVSAPEGPGIYFSRTRLIDAEGQTYGISPLFRRRPSFHNAIVQSIGGGNTMVLNAAAFALFADSACRTAFVAHDWWGYIIVSGAGGFVYYDPEPHIGYRQHEDNSVGSNVGMRARLKRLRRQFDGAFARWNNTNTTALRRCLDLLTPEARETLGEFTAIRQTRSLAAVRRFRRSGIRRQTVQGNIALTVAVALGIT